MSKEQKRVGDISYHNGDIDFEKVSKVLDGLILREGFRKTIDAKFLEYTKGAFEYGVSIYGVYHFMYPLTVEDAIYEAVSCVQNVEKAGLSKDVIIIFADFEYDTFKNAARKGVTLTKNDCNVFTEAFCAQIEKMGYKAGVYMNLDYYKNYYISAIKEKYPIWLADYSGEADYPCLVHQYTNCGRITGINTKVDLNNYFLTNEPVEEKITSAAEVIKLAKSWIGKNEKDGSHKEIIDIYNSYKGSLPRGVKMQYDWSWCACTWSALAIKLGYTHIMPIEISCGELVKAAQKMGVWIESDSYIPIAGDAVLYDWDDKNVSDCIGWPDHVGLVDYVNQDSGYFTVIEGNYSDSVKKRTVSINGKYIRGFIHPKYDERYGPTEAPSKKPAKDIAMEVIAGKWGSGDVRKLMLESAGYNYKEIQTLVNKILNTPKETDAIQIVSSCDPKWCDNKYIGKFITTSDVHMRNDAGTNKKSLCVIPNNTIVNCDGCYNKSQNVDWLCVNVVMNGKYYSGFTSAKYLNKKG